MQVFLILVALAISRVSGDPLSASLEDVSFLQSAINSIQRNNAAVFASNRALDRRSPAVGKHKLQGVSFLQVNYPVTEELASNPMSYLQPAKGRAVAAEEKYDDAIRKLEIDEMNLIEDENTHRTRAAQQRRNFRV